MIINIKVKTNSNEQKIIKLDNLNYIVHLKKLSIKGKANNELLKLLKKYFKSPVSIIKGIKSKNKKIKVEKIKW